MSIPQRNTALVLAVTAVLSLPFLVSVAAAFGGDELETIDLSELSDGETRTFEHADGEIVATRDGNRVVLEIVGADGGHKILMHRSLECDLDDSDCFVRLGSDGDGANTFVFEVRGDDDDPDRIRREVRIVTEHGEHEGIAESIVIGGAPHVRIHRFDGEHGEGHTFGFGDEMILDLSERLREIRMPVIVIASPDESILRCPEGDTTMTVDRDEADSGLYACPKHGTILEIAEPAHGGSTIQWIHGNREVDRDDLVEL